MNFRFWLDLKSNFFHPFALMAFIPPIALAGTFTLSATTTAMVGTLTANVVKDFFTQLFLNPSGNFYGVLIVCGLIVLPCIGLIFLIKKLYEKCFPPTPTV